MLKQETIESLAEAKEMFVALESAFDKNALKNEIADLKKISEGADFWQNQSQAKKTLKQLKDAEEKLNQIKNISNQFENIGFLIELNQLEESAEIEKQIESEIASLQTALQTLKINTLLSGEFDSLNAIISLHAGAGGTESMDWAQMLMRMYLRFAEQNGFKAQILSILEGNEAGIKSAEILIEGSHAYGQLSGENGVHRLVRISPFDSGGRRHTSFASVEVMPEIEDVSTVEINEADLRIDVYRSGGAGGQHVNKTESAVRITHIPTGIVCACQNERSQIQNRELAMKMLVSKLTVLAKKEHLDNINNLKGDKQKIEWGSQIRSYVFCPYTMVKDHRTLEETSDVYGVMDGKISKFLEAYILKK